MGRLVKVAVPSPLVPQWLSVQRHPGLIPAESAVSSKLLSDTMSSSMPLGLPNAIMKLEPAICWCSVCISAKAKPRTNPCSCCSWRRRPPLARSTGGGRRVSSPRAMHLIQLS